MVSSLLKDVTDYNSLEKYAKKILKVIWCIEEHSYERYPQYHKRPVKW